MWAVGKCSPKATAFLLWFFVWFGFFCCCCYFVFFTCMFEGMLSGVRICWADREQEGVTRARVTCPFSPCVPQRNPSAWLTDAPVDSTRATWQEPTSSTSKSSPRPTAHFRLCKFYSSHLGANLRCMKEELHSWLLLWWLNFGLSHTTTSNSSLHPVCQIHMDPALLHTKEFKWMFPSCVLPLWSPCDYAVPCPVPLSVCEQKCQTALLVVLDVELHSLGKIEWFGSSNAPLLHKRATKQAKGIPGFPAASTGGTGPKHVLAWSRHTFTRPWLVLVNQRRQKRWVLNGK